MHTVDITGRAIAILLLLVGCVLLVQHFWSKPKEKQTKEKTAEPKEKVEAKKKKTWLISLRMLVTFVIAVFITLTVREFFRPEWERFITEHDWYAWVTIGVAVVLFCFLFGRSGGHGADDKKGGGGHGGHGGGSNWELVTVVVFLVLMGGWLSGDLQRSFRASTATAATPSSAPSAQNYEVTVHPGQETAIYLPPGTSYDIAPKSFGEKVWVRYEGTTARFQDWRGRPGGGNRRHRPGENYVYLESAERAPVVVEVDIYPAR